jgi:CrcB protein
MSARMLVAVAAGGAAGSVLRYVTVSLVGRIAGTSFPYGTLVVNVAGSAVLGALVAVFALSWSPSPELRALIVVGALGGFTTFSTFSLDAFYLVENGAYAAAAVYVFSSVALSIAGFAAGMTGARALIV